MKKKTPDTEKIVKILSTAKRPVSANRISNTARITYPSVSKRIHDLRSAGYAIDTLTVRGIGGAKYTTYQLAGM